LYTPCVLGLRPLALFNEFLLIKKKRLLLQDSLNLSMRRGDLDFTGV